MCNGLLQFFVELSKLQLNQSISIYISLKRSKSYPTFSFGIEYFFPMRFGHFFFCYKHSSLTLKREKTKFGRIDSKGESYKTFRRLSKRLTLLT
jgi:hypothetical protein